jgi:pimeloyl-ACP methyl ester carboxylesterase
MNYFLIAAYLIGFRLANLQEISEQEVTIQTDQGNLYGSLIEGRNKKKAVLIIAGSGPTDRNGNSTMGFTNNSLKMLAQSISAEGIATLRYDKRVFSTDPSASIPENELRFERLVKDADFAIDFLKNRGFKKVIALGHSQGALIAKLIAKDNADVSAVISIAGSSSPIDEIILEQISRQAPILVDPLKIKLDSIQSGYDVTVDNPFLAPIIRPDIQGFLRSYMTYDPSAIIRQLNQPILIINGTTDLQVSVSDAKNLLKNTLNGQLVIIETMNHVLKIAPSDPGRNMMTYNDPDLPLADGLMAPIIKFINQQ